MRQQVNLYQPTASEGHKPFAAATMGMAGAAVLVCLLLIWGYGAKQVTNLERSVETLRQQVQQQEQAMTAAGASRASQVNPAELYGRVKQLELEVAARRHALDLVRTGAVGRKSGFSAHLEALARRSVDGLWIDHVTLSGTQAAMSVSGGTLNPELVPLYLRGLTREAALAGVRFDELRIERPSEKKAEEGDESTAVPAARQQKGVRFSADSVSLRTVQEKSS